jgi:LPS-assembly protein
MIDTNKGTIKKNGIFTLMLALCLLTVNAANYMPLPINFSSLLTYTNTNGLDTVPKTDTTPKKQIQIDTIDFKIATDGIDDIVEYTADDSAVYDVPTKKFYLYGKKNKVTYAQNNLSAPIIEFDQANDIMSAFLKKDSTGKIISRPIFEQDDLVSMADTLRFNLKTGKGITKNTYSKQGEIFIQSETLKKVDSNTLYAKRTKFTTCNLDKPHFAFVSNKVKIINQKAAFTGPVHPEFEDVPLPITFPFGIFPLKQGRRSGLLPPSFNTNEQLGLSLDGLGYYKILSDVWDITGRATIYSYGGYTAAVSPRYFKRYKYTGGLNIEYQNFKNVDRTGSKNFNLRWNHGSDFKARPGETFGANVNIASAKFNQNIPNNPGRRFTNTLTSSITYSKAWKDKPFNLTVSANHTQNNTTKSVQLDLPTVGFNVNTIYPFKKTERIGPEKWFENIGIGLSTNIRSNTTFFDTTGNFFKAATTNYRWGAQHSIPITLSLPSLGPLQIAPSVSYNESWHQKQLLRSWNNTNEKVDTTYRNGFFRTSNVSFGLNASTRIFGMFGFKKGSRIQAIRHEIRPQFGINYTPDINKDAFQIVQVTRTGVKNLLGKYDNSAASGPSPGRFGGITFGLDNIVQMKVADKTDTSAAATKKVSLIDGLNFRAAYNFLADSFKLSPINVEFRSNLFEKINISAGAQFSPYQEDSLGNQIDQLVWKKRALTLGALTQANISLSTSITGGKPENQANSQLQQQQLLRQANLSNANGMPLDEYEREAAYINNNPAEFADFSIPWDLNFSYALTYTRVRNTNYIGYSSQINQNINGGGSINLTPKWKFTLTGSYDITNTNLGLVTASISREMHCWQMNINYSKSQNNTFFNITINPKSSILRDLKINRTRYFFDF